MKSMQGRMVAATALLAASLTGLAVSTHRYVWPGAAPAPRWIPAPPLAAMVPRPAFPTETREIAVKPGDTRPRVLSRGGLQPRMPHPLDTPLRRRRAGLRP